jgi:hypothetical protein
MPFARGRILSPTQIEVDFPAAGTFIETPDTYIESFICDVAIRLQI